jgi:hypothetical protein
MADISDAKKLLDEINAALSSYDPVMKEQARDILFRQAFGVSPSIRKAALGPGEDAGRAETETVGEEKPQFNSLIERWTPVTQADWVLLGAYYFQKIHGQENVTGFAVNKELKHHGYGVGNITDCFTANMQADPARMLQTKKTGKSKQAKKLYVVTTAGIKYIEEKLVGAAQP